MERQVISKTDFRMMSINTKDINIPNSPQGYQRSRKEKKSDCGDRSQFR